MGILDDAVCLLENTKKMGKLPDRLQNEPFVT